MRQVLSVGAAAAFAVGFTASAVSTAVADYTYSSAIGSYPIKSVAGGASLAGGQRINDPAATEPGYQRNARGQTFGSAADAPRPDLEPDLIWVYTVEGGTGYVYKKDLDGPQPTTREQAIALGDVNRKGRLLIAYASDGITRVGTFQVGGSDAAADAAD